MNMRFVSVAILLFSFLFLSGCLGEIKTPPKIETASISPSGDFTDTSPKAAPASASEDSLKLGNLEIKFLGQSGFLLQSNGTDVYIDPVYLPANAPTADYILITHDHYDHCDAQKVKSIYSENTTIITTEKCAAKLSAFKGNTKVVREGDSYSFLDFMLDAVPAYNLNKSFHLRGEGVGFILEIAGKRIYHAGDTDFIPEMRYLLNIDVALLPIGGKFTMDYDEAAKAVNAIVIKPKIVIPMHYNFEGGEKIDAEKDFAPLVNKNTKVKILKKIS